MSDRLTVAQLLSFVYMRLIEELKDRWNIETQAALIGWHMAGAMSDGGDPVPRPQIPEWMDVKTMFDRWLVSDVDGAVHGADPDTIDPAELDTMIAFGWRE